MNEFSGQTGTGGASPSHQGIPGFGRVLHVLNGLPFGGNETLCYQLMLNFPSEERLLLNIGPERGGMLQRFQGLSGFKFYEVIYDRDARLRFVREVAAILRRIKPAGVIVYPFGLHLLVAIAARMVGVRRVLVHAGNPAPASEERRRLWRWIVRASVLLNTPIISCSLYVDLEFRRLSRLLPRGSRPVFNGIDTRYIWTQANSARSGRTDQRPTVGMVARLSAIKDQDTLVRAIGLVRVNHPDVRLWLVGDGAQRARLEHLVANLGLGAIVEFLGSRNDVAELLGLLDVYVFSTTRDEGFGIAIVEGMSAGLPVIASDVAACREVLEDGGGILVPPRDAKAMAEAISSLLGSQEERARWAARARERVSQFSAARCAREWLRTLTEEH